jgi:DNA-binding transcriptional regulator GbsR (MarR family)
MNNMKSKEKAKKADQDLQKLSHSIGQFIRYWGFRKIHGAIWTQLYLSKTSLNCTELTQKLGVSKALVSPALEELVEYKLIHEAPAPNEKTKVYQAAENINEVIQHVLKTRESTMLKQISEDFATFNKSNSSRNDLNSKRVESLGEMIVSANLMLEIMLSQKDLLNLPSEFEK